MAIQFPNFLGVPLVKSDYSGLGDIFQNYYAGKAMPRDDLIKQIQAEFARPNAEQTLQSLKLGNQGTGLNNEKIRLEIAKYRRDMAVQQELENQIARALRGGNVGSSSAQPMPSQQQIPASNIPSMSSPPDINSSINPALARAVQQQFQQSNPNQPVAPTAQMTTPNVPMGQSPDQMPSMPSASVPVQQTEQPSNNLQVITQGEPRFAAIDKLWDQNPLSRELLKKKGFDKKTEVKFDSKTGQTRIMTSYPSGKRTLEVIGTSGMNGEAPMTTANVTKQQAIITGIDNTIPVIKDILALDKSTSKNKEWEPYPRNSGIVPGLGWVPGYHSKATNYESLVSSALDTLLGAYGLPKTNEGIETVKKQLLIGHGETDSAYKKRLMNLMKDLQRRKEYSASLLKKTINNPPRDTGSNETYSSDDWETTNE
jgi:hypothetical protein